jgi:hypothetical protein
MKNRNIQAITIRLFICTVLMICMLSGPAGAADLTTTDVVKNILLRTMHKGDPTRTERLQSYSQASAVPMTEIEGVLIGFAERGWQTAEETKIAGILCAFSVEILGDLRVARADSLLKCVSRSDNSNLRRRAIRSLVEIGGEGILDFADEVINNTKLYTDLDRFALYEELGAIEKAGGYPESEIDDKIIGRFLERAYEREKDSSNRNLLHDLLNR